MWKEHIVVDIIFGLVLFSTWLNVKNGNLQSLTNGLTEEKRSAIIGLLIISFPLLFEFLFNIDDILGTVKESANSKSNTSIVVVTSSIIAIFTREFVVDYKDNLERREVIFWELFNNHRNLDDSIQLIKKIQGFTKKAILDQWNSLIKEKWRKTAYEKHSANLDSTYLLDSKTISLIKKIYEEMNILIENIEKDKVNPEYPLEKVQQVLSDVSKILQEIDPSKAQGLIDKK
jgi:hypothetical protein